jgi:thiamine pyrophosphate-dependent acetolactate synthase large subunit-like protein
MVRQWQELLHHPVPSSWSESPPDFKAGRGIQIKASNATTRHAGRRAIMEMITYDGPVVLRLPRKSTKTARMIPSGKAHNEMLG